MEISHSYEGLARQYFELRRGTPRFAAFVISHAGLHRQPLNKPLTIVELGVGAGQQTEYIETELDSAGFSQYTVLAFDKSYQSGSGNETAQLNLIRDRINDGIISSRVSVDPV